MNIQNPFYSISCTLSSIVSSIIMQETDLKIIEITEKFQAFLKLLLYKLLSDHVMAIFKCLNIFLKVSQIHSWCIKIRESWWIHWINCMWTSYSRSFWLSFRIITLVSKCIQGTVRLFGYKLVLFLYSYMLYYMGWLSWYTDVYCFESYLFKYIQSTVRSVVLSW